MKKSSLSSIILTALMVLSCGSLAKSEPNVEIEKALLYDTHTLTDTYPYKKSTRQFQWDKIRTSLVLVDSIQATPASWGILQNAKNKNGQAPLVKDAKLNDYKRPIDAFKVEQYQGIPLYKTNDLTSLERYGNDGSLVKIIENDPESSLFKIENIALQGEWYVPKKYIHLIDNKVRFNKVIFVDRTNQNITTIEKDDNGQKWLIRSMNPTTTGLHHPPFQMETPVGIFVLQEKKSRMIYYKDGTTEKGGFAPYANRFSTGAYLHGVPVDLPRTEMVEFSPTLGTTPRSHKCVRNATSHAEFIYKWAPIDETLVFVFD